MSRHPFLRSVRAVFVALVAASILVTASLTWAPPALGASRPQVIAGSKIGPLAVPSPKSKVVARLALPKGAWFVTAKGILSNAGHPSGHAGVNCRLALGSRTDRISGAPGTSAEGGTYLPFLLTVAGRLGSAGNARLSCVGETSALRISDIRMNAVRVGRLTTQGITAAATTTGSGAPRVISGRRANDEVNGDDAYHAVATLPLPKGAWWIVAKAVASASNSGTFFACRLVAGVTFDELDFGLRPRFGPSEAVPLGLQVVHRYDTPGTARFECKGPDGFDVTDTVITAVKVGKLTNRSLSNGITVTSGSSWPRVISGWLNGPTTIPVGLQPQTVAQMTLPKGRWMILAKLWFQGEAVPADFFRAVCQLVLQSGKDVSVIEYIPNPTRVAPIVMSRVRQTSSQAVLKLRCVRFPGGGTSAAYFVKLTAFKAASVTLKKL